MNLRNCIAASLLAVATAVPTMAFARSNVDVSIAIGPPPPSSRRCPRRVSAMSGHPDTGVGTAIGTSGTRDTGCMTATATSGRRTTGNSAATVGISAADVGNGMDNRLAGFRGDAGFAGVGSGCVGVPKTSRQPARTRSREAILFRTPARGLDGRRVRAWNRHAEPSVVSTVVAQQPGATPTHPLKER